MLVDAENCDKFFDADVAGRLKFVSTELSKPLLDINNPHVSLGDIEAHIGKITAHKILEERKKHGPFTSQQDFMDRMGNYPHIRRNSLNSASQMFLFK